MGKRGPPKAPTAVKKARGTLRKDRTNPDEPQPLGKLGPPPKSLKAEGKRRWDELVRTRWWLTDADRDTAEMYCKRWELWLDAVAEVKQRGQLNVKKDGGWVQISGTLSALDSHEKALNELNRRLGGDPASRADLSVPEKPSRDGTNRFAIN